MFDAPLTDLARLITLMVTFSLLSCSGQVRMTDDDDSAVGDDDVSDDDAADDDAADDDAADDDASDDDASDDDASDDDTGDDDDTSPFAGNYTGVVELTHATPDGQVQVACTGEAVFVVDGNGALHGDGMCHPNDNLPPLPIALDGDVAGDGAVSGTATHVIPNAQESYELTGGFVGGGGFQLQWSGEMQTPMGDVIHFEGTVSG